MKISEARFISLRDQISLSPGEFEQAKVICSEIKQAVENRERFILDQKLNPEVHLPGANWSLDDPKNIAACAYRKIVEGDFNTINSLRMYSQMFSGYSLDKMLPNWEAYPQGGWFETSLEDIERGLGAVSSRGHQDSHRYLQLAEELPAELHITPPRRFGEVGWELNGKLINHDTAAYLERMALLYQAGVFKLIRESSSPSHRPLRILEIGGGFGALAYQFKRLVPNCRYFIVDLPESLIFSAIYLSTLYPTEENWILKESTRGRLPTFQSGFTFVPNYLLSWLREAKLEFDVVINTLSMSEMKQVQVEYYADSIREFIASHGVFFEQNQDLQKIGLLNVHDILAKFFPYSEEVMLQKSQCTQGRAWVWLGCAPERLARPMFVRPPFLRFAKMSV